MANEFKIKKGLIVTGASGGTVVDIQGSQGQLFSVTDDLSGSIFAVSDISGVPILDVNSSGLVTVDGPFTQTGGGDSNFSGDIILQSATPKISLIDTDAGDSFSVNNFTGNFVIKNDTDDVDPLIINGANNAIFAGDVSGVAGTFTGNLAVGNASAAEIYLNRNSANYINASNAAGYLVFRTGGTTTALTLNATGAGTFGTQAFATTATSSGDASSTLTTKGYVDGLITGATIYRGAWDPSGGGYGSPDLSGVTQTSGYYYICSAAGTAEPNGTGTEPDTWAVGDWVIYNDVSGTGQWQKIDNSSVLSGVGTGQTVALWEGASSVTDSETLGNAPITVSGNNTTFAGNVTAASGIFSDVATLETKLNGNDSALNFTTASGDTFRIGLKDSDDTFRIAKSDASLATNTYLTIDSSGNSTFAGDVTVGAHLILKQDGGNDLIKSTGSVLYHKANEYSFQDNSNNSWVTIKSGNVGIGTTSPSQRLHVSGSMRLTGAFRDGLNSQGAANYVLTSTGSNSTRWVDASTVTGGPYLPLAGGTMDASANINMNSGTLSSVDFIDFGIGQLNGVSTSNLILKSLGDITYNVDSNNNGNSSHIFQESGSELMRIRYDGNVGIGTTSPDVSLEVVTASPTDGIVADFVNSTNAGGTIAAIKLSNSDSENCDVVLGANRVGADFGSDFFISLSDGVDGTNRERFRITEAGNVGIGTASPGAKLDVDVTGNNTVLKLTRDEGVNGVFDIDFQNANTNFNSLYAYTFQTDNTERMRITSGGNVGIGTTSPAFPIHVNTSNDVVGYFKSTDNKAAIIIADNDTTGYISAENDRVSIGYGSGASTANITIVNGSYNVGIGTTSPSEKLDIFGNLRISYDASNYFTVEPISNGNVYFKPTGGSIHVAKTTKNNQIFLYDYTGASTRWGEYDASSIVLKTSTNTAGIVLNTDGNSYINGSNVGIGTTSPSRKLQIDNSSGVGEAVISGTTGATLYFRPNTSYTVAGNFGIFTTGLTSGTYESTMDFKGYYNGVTTPLTIKGSGNVGIGVTNPSTKLHVGGIVQVTESSNTAFYGGNYLRVFNGQVYTMRNSSGNQRFAFDNTSGTLSTYNSSNVRTTYFNNSGSSYINGGNVGIGTTSPGYKLDINGSFRSNALFTDASANAFWGNGNVATAYGILTWDTGIAKVFATSGNRLDLGANGAVAATINTNGNVGIGTTIPGHKLQVNGGIYATNYLSVSGVNTNFNLYNNGTTYLNGNTTVDSTFLVTNGNVGIGTTSPSQLLHVAGNMRLQNQLYDSTNSLGSNNQVLTKVSAGTQWKDAPVNAQMPDNTAPASAANVGTIRYRTSGNNSYVDMCMQTGVTTYAWINIVQNNW